MRKWKQRLFSLLLCGVMLFSLCTPAAALDISITNGDLDWSFDESSGTLTITCTADKNVPMPDFTFDTIPWKSHQEEITSVVFNDGPGHFTSIGDFAFYGCTNLPAITLPEGVISIGDRAFFRCTNLPAIELPESLKSIGEYAFYDCENLTTIKLPEGLTSIEGSAFDSCKKLTAINLPESVTSIGVGAFLLCESLTAIELPEGLTSIEDNTFTECKSLTEIKLPESLTSIKWSAFDSCESLTTIKLPEGLISIGEYAFQDCTSLTAIELPETVTSIGDSAFDGCESLTAINLPDGVTSVGKSVFEGCESLKTIDLPKNLTVIGDLAFYGCESLETIQFPEGLSSIGEQAFYKCTSLGSITLPGSLKSIGEEAFSGCESLKTIKLPENVTSIENDAFEYCTGLTSVTFSSETPPILGRDVFYGCDALTEIRVPAGKEEAYGSALTDAGLSADSVTVKGGYPVTVTAGEGGTASASPNFASEWETVTLTATPNSGWQFKEWQVIPGGVTVSGNSFTMPAASVAVNAVFEKETTGGGSSGGSSGGSYTPPTKPTYPPALEKPSEGGGTPSIFPSDPKQGDTVTVTPKPDDGYEVDKITVTDRNDKPVEVTKKPDGTYTFRQPNGQVTIEIEYAPVPLIDRPWTSPFSDVPVGDWYYEAVRFVQENGLMNGYSDGRFGPNDSLSRAQLAQILFNKEGRPAVSGGGFNDVDSSAWYAGAVIWAAENGIVGGYGNGTFGPNDSITREQLAVMLWRYSGSPAATDQELHFNDTDEISGFALEAMRWAVKNGILNGYGDGQLGPQGQAARAQAAQMLKNFMEAQGKNA